MLVAARATAAVIGRSSGLTTAPATRTVGVASTPSASISSFLRLEAAP